MEAKEFVKKFGWLKAYDIVAHIPDRFMSCYYGRVCYCTKYKKYSDRFQPRITLVNMADLKRLIESHDLVQSYGGCNEAISYLNKKHIFAWDALDGQLSQAIADVESCQ